MGVLITSKLWNILEFVSKELNHFGVILAQKVNFLFDHTGHSIVGFLFIIIIFISRSSVPQGPIDHQVRSMKAGEAVDYMKMGLVKEVRRNGAVVHVKEEGEDKEQRFFIPGKASKILLTNS